MILDRFATEYVPLDAAENSGLLSLLYGEWCVLRVAGFVGIRMPPTELHRILTNPATKKHFTLPRAKYQHASLAAC